MASIRACAVGRDQTQPPDQSEKASPLFIPTWLPLRSLPSYQTGGGQTWEVRRQLNMGLKTEDAVWVWGTFCTWPPLCPRYCRHAAGDLNRGAWALCPLLGSLLCYSVVWPARGSAVLQQLHPGRGKNQMVLPSLPGSSKRRSLGRGGLSARCLCIVSPCTQIKCKLTHPVRF